MVFVWSLEVRSEKYTRPDHSLHVHEFNLFLIFHYVLFTAKSKVYFKTCSNPLRAPAPAPVMGIRHSMKISILIILNSVHSLAHTHTRAEHAPHIGPYAIHSCPANSGKYLRVFIFFFILTAHPIDTLFNRKR